MVEIISNADENKFFKPFVFLWIGLYLSLTSSKDGVNKKQVLREIVEYANKTKQNKKTQIKL